MNVAQDTIAALATPPGRGGVGIIRISGPLAHVIAEQMLGGLPLPRQAVFSAFRSREGLSLDEGIALYFPAPASFTGEDVLELQGHGGPIVMDMLLREVLAQGARLARPGEFSERAFLNDKLDLVQAEAIADLIDSATQEAARAALRSLHGDFSRRVNELNAALVELRVFVESSIDFSDEEIEFISEGHVSERLLNLIALVNGIEAQAQQGQLLNDGMHVVIAGRPNAGKSSLLNRLAAREAAIVTEIPGTTRDILREFIQLDGLPVYIIDTAGLRDTDDIVEREGVARARAEIDKADRVLLVVDDASDWEATAAELLAHFPSHLPVTVIRNKIDISGNDPGQREGPFGTEIALSALNSSGLDILRLHLKAVAGFRTTDGGSFSARRRHLDALRAARRYLERGLSQFSTHYAGELLAEDLRQAQLALAQITGAFTSDDLLGEIFSTFCIGK